MFKLISIEGNSLKLDAGTMFGHVPKALWSKWYIADKLNRIRISCRSLLVRDNGKNILFDVGVGVYLNSELRRRYGIENRHILLESLAKQRLTHEDINFIVLSHLHFDHIGGLLPKWHKNYKPTLLFPNAKILISEKAWYRANNPHIYDQASFAPEINELIANSGRLKIVSDANLLGPKYRFHFSDGHTPGLISTEINTENGSIIFVSDLIVGTHWVHLPISTSYDRAPEIATNEKEQLLIHAMNTNAHLFYVHDPETVTSEVKQDETGHFYATNLQSSFAKATEEKLLLC